VAERRRLSYRPPANGRFEGKPAMPRRLVLTAAVAVFAGLGLAMAAGVDLAGMDRAVAPGDDFFAYANGGWLKTAEIPADRSSWGNGAMLIEKVAAQTADLIKSAGAGAAAGTPGRQVADYYAAYLDEGAIEAKGLAPIRPDLARIAAIGDRTALARELGGEIRADVDVFNNTNLHTDRMLGLWVAQDLDDPTRYSAFLVQGGLGMPDRDYYLDPSPKMEMLRQAYRAHIARVLILAGAADPEGEAGAIFDLEAHIARFHASRADSEDVTKGDNHWTPADLARRAPGLDWPAFLAAAGLSGQDRLVIWEPAAVTGIAALAETEPLETWKAWLAFHAIDRASEVLPMAFAEENFDFYSRVLSGTPKRPARWKQAVAATSAALGEAVGKLYADRYFSPEAKAQVEAMCANIVAAFARRIDRLSWMAPATKAEAKAKLAALKIGVGYPDHWRDYSGLEVRPDDAFGNKARAELFDTRWNLAKLGRPVDRGEWAMTPQTVNAVNLPAMNALNFPAAYLQPPYFDPGASLAINYGALGGTIGHEISHSFDDQGALFDAKGRLRNWWTKADFARFEREGGRLAAQYDLYRPFPDLAVRGRQTLSENIADLAGLGAAHDAYLRALNGRPAPVEAGFTADQQFFVAYAQHWRNKVREAALRRQILTDGHAPSAYRADTARNLDAWYAAFKVKPGQKLYLAPDQRVRMW
jgi:predicted metalloendopeptidase